LGFCEARFIGDWQQLQSFADDADIEWVRAMASDIQQQLRIPTSREHLLQLMEDSFSGAIQLSPWQACVADNPLSEDESLARQYLLRTRRMRLGSLRSGRIKFHS
jgi:hypothetical protein